MSDLNITGDILPEQSLPVSLYYDGLKEALRVDPEYAWTWQSHIAISLMDSLNASNRDSNIAAARIMKNLFNYDVTQNPFFKELEKRWG